MSFLADDVKVSLHSDDPAYFGRYIATNYYALAQKYALTREQLGQLARNLFETAWISAEQKARYLAELEVYLNAN